MSEPVIARVEGQVGRLTLSRPKALHALNLEMCEIILAALSAWAGDDEIAMVMIDHDPETRGFCAGGDIRMLAESGAGDASEARAFFAAEYRMNAAIKNFPKPYLALMDGITMGGGVGLSVHGTHRVATERTVFAMPETGIGLFLDVAAARVATHFLPSEMLPHLKRQVLSADYSGGAAEMVGEVLRQNTHSVPAGSFEGHIEAMGRCFGFDTAEEIVAALEAEDSDWAREQLATLATKSPETVKVALRQLREGARLDSFEENMAMEYRIGWRKVQSHDFQEGVRAVIIDKDNAPVWSPATLEGVSEADVVKYFEPLGEDELSFG